jgi:hypothetical protein
MSVSLNILNSKDMGVYFVCAILCRAISFTNGKLHSDKIYIMYNLWLHNYLMASSFCST